MFRHSTRKITEGKKLLDRWATLYESKDFIKDDPISIPHQFNLKQDIEIIGFWVAMIAWGNRTSIINSGNRLIQLMDHAPYDFILNHQEKDRKRFLTFKHRTFQPTDAIYFISYLQDYYTHQDSLEDAFIPKVEFSTMRERLAYFHQNFFNHPYAPQRTKKHVANPNRKASCKRLNMFLRWMVRPANQGVDFGLWEKIRPSELMMPLDVHVGNTARKWGLLTRKQNDWKAVEELTANLRLYDRNDPVKYDYALFGCSVYGEKGIV